MAQNKAQQQQLTAMFARYNQRLGMLYAKFIKELAKLGYNVEDKLKEDTLFLFDNFPELKQRLNDILAQYVQENVLLARLGIASGVGIAFQHANEAMKGYSVLNDDAVSRIRNYAIQAFTQKRLNGAYGLNLSHRVWNYAEQTKSEFEMAMSNVVTDGLKQGTSAAELSRRVRAQLNEPDMMYRRYHHKVVTKGGAAKDVVRWHKRIIDEDGNVRFVEAPLEEVGQGVYRSSYKNTFRLMRSEINMSYHYANNVRWQSEPFVIGIRIWGSPQHPKKDICDELWGNYPKDFLFSGFHPQCLCAAAAITCSREEMREYHRRKRAGEDMSNWKPQGFITDVPEAFKQHVREHKVQIMGQMERGTIGYVFRDNQKYWRSEFTKEEQEQMGIYVKEKRTKTAADKLRIQQQWYEHQMHRAQMQMSAAGVEGNTPVMKQRLDALRNAIDSGNYDNIKAAYAEVQHGIRIQQTANERHANRNAQAIQSAWDARRKQNALVFGTGKNVLAVAQKLGYADTAAKASLLQDLLLEYKLQKVQELTKELAKQIAEVNKQATQLQYVQDAKKHLKKVTIAELQGVEAGVASKVIDLESKWGKTNYGKLEDKYNWEAYEFLGKNMKGVQDKYPNTWHISQEAYIALAAKMHEMPLWQNLQAQLGVLKAYPTKSPKYQKEVQDAEALLLAKVDLAAAQSAVLLAEKHMKDLEAQKKYQNKKKGIASHSAVPAGAKTLADIPLKEALQLVSDFEANYTDSADMLLRPVIKRIYAGLTHEERLVLTKYTETYSYLNEPLREINYGGGRTKAEFLNDMPILTSALSKMQMPDHAVVRRGTGDFTIKSLGKSLSKLNVGDEFVDGAFLSTAVRIDKGLGGSYDMIIVVPKGAHGAYVEPLTYYNRGDQHGNRYSSGVNAKENLWDGSYDAGFGIEREWIGQRGSKFRVIKKSGRKIYLQLIGQYYEQTSDPSSYIR